jgi:hypothetical protein
MQAAVSQRLDERGMLARPDRYPSGMGNAVTTGFAGFS